MQTVNVAKESADEQLSRHGQFGPRFGHLGSRQLPFTWDWGVLLAGLVTYAILVTYLSDLRAGNLFTAAWDLGINQQLLSTTAHGRLLYETADLASYNAHSYLQVHSTYIAFAIAPIYAAVPVPSTLFALQSSLFAASAIPLYIIASEYVRRPWLRLASVSLYLLGFGVISGLMFDFHWESFLPLEFLVFFLLVRRERFAASLVPFALGTLTLEVFPFLAAGVLLLGLFDRAEHLSWNRHRLLKDPSARLLCAMLVLALAAYVTVRVFQYTVIPATLGVPSSTGGSAGGIASTIGWGANATTLPDSLAYWLLVFATFGFLPVLAPRYLILSSPWFTYSVIVAPWFSHYFGGAFTLIAAAPLAVAAVVGLGEVERWRATSRLPLALFAGLVALTVALLVLSAVPGGSARILMYSDGPSFWVFIFLLLGIAVALSEWMRRERSHPAVTEVTSSGQFRTRSRGVLPLMVAMIVTVLLFDAVMSPMNGANQGATPIPGYQFSWGQNPMSGEMNWITSQLPANAQVLASNHLFPYVANDPNAWAVPFFVIDRSNPMPWFPFTPENLPRYALVDAMEMPWVPSFLAVDLFNASVFGLVAYAFMTQYPGTVYLFERGYAGGPQAREVVAPRAQYDFGSANLTVGPAGRVENLVQSEFGHVIVSSWVGPAGSSEENIWGGPNLSMLPGSYRVTFNLSGVPALGSSGSQPVLDLRVTWTAGAEAPVLWQAEITAAGLPGPSWIEYSVVLNLSQPYPLVNVQGFLVLINGQPAGQVELNYIHVQAVAA